MTRLHPPHPPSVRRRRAAAVRRRLVFAAGAALACTLAGSVDQLSAQSVESPDRSGVRVGFAVGGISSFGLVAELFDGNNSLELGLGTWSFRDLSVSVVAKRRIGSRDVRPFVGAGLWFVLAKPPEERLGAAAVLRVPVGVDLGIEDHHFLGAINLNRGLWVRRPDPEDDLPLNRRIIPLPELGYRWERR